MMLLRINTLVKGYSGVSLHLVMKLIEAFNKKIIPKVPCQGSLGASGDLAPLSHLILPLIDDGDVYDPDKNEYVNCNEYFEKVGF